MSPSQNVPVNTLANPPATPLPAPTAGARCAADLAALLRARNPLIVCVTREEARAERIVLDACSLAGYAPTAWDCVAGFTSLLDNRPVNAALFDVQEALAFIRDNKDRRAYVMRDLSSWLRDPNACRALKNLCRTLPQTPRDNARAVVVISPTAELPPELQGSAIVVDIPLPDRAEVGSLLDAAVAALPEDRRANAAPNGARDAAIDAAIGLSSEEIQSTFSRSLILKNSTLDPAIISGEKRRVISKERVLDWVEPLKGGLAAIGGLANLKGWLSEQKLAFSPKARAYGLPAPRGVLLTGVPGCGKSYSAKAIASAWGLPLLRLDMGGLKAKFVGESEANLRRALKVAESLSPCVLWLDEVEKALSGATQGAADGGVSSDALGTILTWLEERAGSVFVVATANDAWLLPAPLFRRFDAVFFHDMPTRAERVEILAAAMAKHGRALAPVDANVDAETVAEACPDFSGAEVANLVPKALFRAFADGAREPLTADLVAAAQATVPLARTAADQISKIRTWASGRAMPASAPDASTSSSSSSNPSAARSLDLS